MPVDPIAALRDFHSSTGLDPALPALVAYSAGPDSTCLLHCLAALDSGPLRAVYVDHGLRPEAERVAEEELARATCRALSVPLTVARARPDAIAGLARARGIGIEAAAREFRHRAFRRILAREGTGQVYLAHTRDDQLETILMRALSGSGARGLAGMPPLSPPFARPFLGLRKADLLEWLGRRGIPWSTDSSNPGDEYARNRLRHLVLGPLSQAFPGWEGGLLETARKARLDDEALARFAAPLAFAPSGRGLVAPPGLLDAPAAIRRRVFLEGASRLVEGRGPSARLPSRLADAAFAALGGGASSYTGGGIRLRRGERGLELASALDFPGPGGYFVTIAGPDEAQVEFHAGRFRVSIGWIDAVSPGAGSRASRLRELAFSFPLIVRSRRPGDFLAMEGGRKAVDELLAGQRVPAAERDRVPILQDRDGIVAVLAASSGGRDRYRPSGVRDTGRYLSINVEGA